MNVVLVSIGSGGRYGGLSRQLLSLPTLEAYVVRHEPEVASRCDFTHLVFDVDEVAAEQVAAAVLDASPDVVGFGCYIWNTTMAHDVARLLRLHRPAVRILFGGPNASALYQEILAGDDAVDVVVLGEGEETFRELLRRELAGEQPDESCPGIAWRADGEVRCSPSRPHISDMESLVSPYLSGHYSLDSGCFIETMRGCPFDCTYCVWGETDTRYFPLERVLAELDMLNRPDIRTVVFVDSIFNLNQERAHRILEHLLEIDFQPWIWIELHPRLVDDRTIALLRRFRRAYVALGVQSTNPSALEASRRKQESGHAGRIVKALTHDDGPCVALQYVMGLPEDDLDGFVATTNWVFETAPGSVGCFHLSVVPGSRIHREADELGLVYDRERLYRLISSPTMSAAEVHTAAGVLYWIQRWPGLFYRLGLFSGRPVGDLLLDWCRLLEAEGLAGDQIPTESLESGASSLVRFLQLFGQFVAGMEIGPDPEGVAARLSSLLTYTMARLHAVDRRWHYREAIDVSGIWFQDRGLVAPPWTEPLAGRAPRGALHFRAPAVTIWFDQDPVALMEARELDALLAVDQGAHYLIFFHPRQGAARACPVDAAQAQTVQRLQQGVPVEQLGEIGRQIASALLRIGLCTETSDEPVDERLAGRTC